ncbi:MAG: efflux RND transporter periplasmic adaptor subunit [Gammaproteobacteria bacterium]|nr:efflux RND transporter periplasmic adaptor subunit [Gammaproteobacteria bacterium]
MRFYLSPRPLLGLSALLMMLACNRAPPPAVDATPPPVSVAAAIEREITLTDEFPGQIEALETVAIQARVNGYLQSIHFKPGTEIKRGDLLFVIDPRPFAARLVEVEATLANSHAQLALAKAELKRQTDMLETHATSEREFEAATAAVQSLEAGIRGNQASIASARLDLEYTRITAPIDGRVGKDEVTVGNLVQGDSGSPVLTTLVSVDPVYVSFEADEHAYLKYLSGTRSERLSVEVGLADETDFPHQATLDFVDNQLSTTSGTVRLRAVMMNPDRRFTPGLFARVRLHSATKSAPVVLVAERAIGTDQSKRFVLTVGVDKIANYREVRIGRQVGNLRVIESGLALGEVIVVSGLQRVRPGAPVTPELVPMDAGKALASP